MQNPVGGRVEVLYGSRRNLQVYKPIHTVGMHLNSLVANAPHSQSPKFVRHGVKGPSRGNLS